MKNPPFFFPLFPISCPLTLMKHLLRFLLPWLLLTACEPPQIRYEIPGPRPEFEAPRIDALPAGTPGLKFLVYGDWGGGNPWRPGSDYGQRQVAEGMAAMVAREDRGVDFALGVGDNFYSSGVNDVNDSKWRTVFEEIYDTTRFPIPFYMVLGNHDYGKDPMAQVAYHRLENSTATGRWYMPDRYYTFADTLADATIVQFFALDSPVLIGDGTYRKYRERTQGPDDESERQMAWLTEQLAGSRARWKIVFMHHPVFSNGNHGDTPWLIAHLKPLLERYDVQVVFSGHNHDLEAIKPVNGVHYFVSGGGANAFSVAWRENTLFAYAGTGFLWCRMTREELLITFCDREGNPLQAIPVARDPRVERSVPEPDLP